MCPTVRIDHLTHSIFSTIFAACRTVLYLMPGLYSRRDSTRQDKNESVKGTLSHLPHSRPALILSRSCRRHVGKSSLVKGSENVLPRYRRFSHVSVNVYIRAYFISFTFCQKSRKLSKERIIILLAVNSDGTEKLLPLAIRKSARPRYFKNIKRLPCYYKNQHCSWMTAKLFHAGC